jgi:3-oxoacyl-[acyl-carrier protein] reductase
VQGDVSEDRDCRRLVEAAATRWGRVDALVNSAGTTRFVPMADLEAVDAADFQRIYAVNAVGPFQMARAAAPLLRRNGGAIVNVSSTSSQTGNGSSWPYIASKGALNTLTLGLARMLAPQARVNAVLPGMIEGRWFLEGLGEDAYRRVRDSVASVAALGTVCTPAQVAEAVVWLLTGTAVTTGQLLTIDAGVTLGRPPVLSRDSAR